MISPAVPSRVLYQFHTRLSLSSLSQRLGRPATLDDVHEADLARLAEQGFDWLYLLGIWQTGNLGLQLARENSSLRNQLAQSLPDVQPGDISSSCFAIASYHVPPEWGGDAALDRLHQRMCQHGLRLMLDFVPNHTAIDHAWAWAHPEYYLEGRAEDLLHNPPTHRQVQTSVGLRVLAHGRDPNFPAWTDTLQLNYAQPALHAAMLSELLRIAELCDGLRCDMAMLLLPEVFERAWGLSAPPFWPAAIARLRQQRPGFTLLAEVYWDLETTLLEQGFDGAYDKRLLDALRAQQVGWIRQSLSVNPRRQARLARFLENHDEPRAAQVFPSRQHQAAAILAYLTPALAFFHQGQMDGFRLPLPVQLGRLPQETVDLELHTFYQRLLAALHLARSQASGWQMLQPIPAWDGNLSHANFFAYFWHTNAGGWLAVVNYAPHPGQCYLVLPIPTLRSQTCQLGDWFSPASYQRQGDELLDKGLYLDLPAWGYHLFALSTQS